MKRIWKKFAIRSELSFSVYLSKKFFLAVPPILVILISTLSTMLLQRCNSPEIGVPDLYIYLPGSVISDWFSYQGDRSPLRIQLPPFETWWNIAGFAVSDVFGGRKRLEPFCCIEVNSKSGVAWSRLYQVPIPGASKVVSDHLSLFFAASDKLDPDKEWNPTELFLDFPEEEIKECGIRVVYEKDIQELVQ